MEQLIIEDKAYKRSVKDTGHRTRPHRGFLRSKTRGERTRVPKGVNEASTE